MGHKLTGEFMDYGPDLPGAEWKAMIVLADDANDETRLTYHGVNEPEITRRIRLSPQAWTNLRGVLVRKGLLEVVESGKKGRCAKYRIPSFAPSVRTADPEIGHETHDESSPIGHETHEASAKYVMRSVTPTSHKNFSGENRFSGVAAGAATEGSPSDRDGATADAVDVSSIPSQRRRREGKTPQPAGKNPKLSDRVSDENRARCNAYISTLARLSNDETDKAVYELWRAREKVWLWAHGQMRKRFHTPPLPKDWKTEYPEVENAEQARFMYEKALRCMSRDGDWHECLVQPLKQLMESDQSSEAPPWAA